jgi:hypothetical protein
LGITLKFGNIWDDEELEEEPLQEGMTYDEPEPAPLPPPPAPEPVEEEPMPEPESSTIAPAPEPMPSTDSMTAPEADGTATLSP